jgi:hypothetical protein
MVDTGCFITHTATALNGSPGPLFETHFDGLESNVLCDFSCLTEYILRPF